MKLQFQTSIDSIEPMNRHAMLSTQHVDGKFEPDGNSDGAFLRRVQFGVSAGIAREVKFGQKVLVTVEILNESVVSPSK